MGFRTLAAILAAAAPLALAAQVTPPDTTTATTTAPAAKKPYVPHKTPYTKKETDKAKGPAAPKKPSPPSPPAPPKRPANVPAVIYDRQGNAIPTSPEAYDVSSATKKK